MAHRPLKWLFVGTLMPWFVSSQTTCVWDVVREDTNNGNSNRKNRVNPRHLPQSVCYVAT